MCKKRVKKNMCLGEKTTKEKDVTIQSRKKERQ